MEAKRTKGVNMDNLRLAVDLNRGPTAGELRAQRAANENTTPGARHGYTGSELARYDARMDLRWALTWWAFASALLVMFLMFNADAGWDYLEGPRALLILGWVFMLALVIDSWRRWRRATKPRPMAVPKL